MTVLNGLPAHVLLVHFIFILAPLTAMLEIACAVWTYRIGDTGAQSVWGNEIAHLKQDNAN